MNIWINSDSHQLFDNMTLAEALEQIGLSDQQGLAVAVNQAVIPRASWADFKLKENDNVMIIRATQGG